MSMIWLYHWVCWLPVFHILVEMSRNQCNWAFSSGAAADCILTQHHGCIIVAQTYHWNWQSSTPLWFVGTVDVISQLMQIPLPGALLHKAWSINTRQYVTPSNGSPTENLMFSKIRKTTGMMVWKIKKTPKCQTVLNIETVTLICVLFYGPK